MSKILFVRGLKLLPVLMSVVLSCFIIFSNYNREYYFINNVSGTSIFTTLIVYTTAKALGFCALHRTFIVYDTVASIWIDVRSMINVKIVCCLGNWIVILFAIVLYCWLLIFELKKASP